MVKPGRATKRAFGFSLHSVLYKAKLIFFKTGGMTTDFDFKVLSKNIRSCRSMESILPYGHCCVVASLLEKGLCPQDALPMPDLMPLQLYSRMSFAQP